jgi:hypothetical protein
MTGGAPGTGRFLAAAFVVAACAAAAGCTPDSPPEPYVARVGDRTLTRAELARTLADRPSLQDSSEAATQIVERWIANELLYQEAMERGLQNEEQTRRLLAENERSVLISALVNRVYEEEMSAPDETSIRAYYESHHDQLRLREPYVRVRVLVVDSELDARLAADSLRALSEAALPDSAFPVLADRISLRPEDSRSISDSFYPANRLFSWIPGMASALTDARAGDVLPPLFSDDVYYVVQLVERIPVGTIPDLDMIRDELAERVSIEERKQLFARHVQRLRTRALSRDRLEVHSPSDSSGSGSGVRSP